MVLYVIINNPVNIYLFKVDNKSTIKRCEICSALTIKAPELRHWLWTYFTPFSSVSVVNFKQVNVSWEMYNNLNYWQKIHAKVCSYSNHKSAKKALIHLFTAIFLVLVNKLDIRLQLLGMYVRSNPCLVVLHNKRFLKTIGKHLWRR